MLENNLNVFCSIQSKVNSCAKHNPVKHRIGEFYYDGCNYRSRKRQVLTQKLSNNVVMRGAVRIALHHRDVLVS
jgi:hypothetical protein